MYEVPTNQHDNTPETYVRNNQEKTIDGIWISAGINPTASGYLDYNGWDHRPVWIEFNERQVFGHRELKTLPIKARRLKLENKSSTNLYKQNLLKLYNESNFYKKFWETARKIDERGINPMLWNDLDALDRIRWKFMIKAEKKCRKFNAVEVPFSPLCFNSSKAILFLNTALKRCQGKNISSRKIDRMRKKLT